MLGVAFGFVAGVLVCGLIVTYVLPPLVRYHSAETVRAYQQFVAPESAVRVIVLERPASNGGERAERRYVPSRGTPDEFTLNRDTPASTLRVDPAAPLPSSISPVSSSREQPTEEIAILRHVYEQNLRLRKQLTGGMSAPATVGGEESQT